MKVCWSLSLLVLITLVLEASGLRCRLCRRARNREECQGFQECSYDEECFLDEIITNLAETIFVGGCRAKDVCAVSSGAIGKRSRDPRAAGDFVACSRCCRDDYCNEKLCGLPMDKTVLHCLACGDRDGVDPVPPVRYPEDCAHEKVCQHNEMCFASTQMFNGVQLEHTTKCMEKSLCHKLMNATFETADAQKGKRYSTPICAVCCGDDYCNSYACETIKRPELVGQSIINFNCMYEQTIYFSRPQWVMNVLGLGTKTFGEGRLLNLRADGFLDYENLKEDLWALVG